MNPYNPMMQMPMMVSPSTQQNTKASNRNSPPDRSRAVTPSISETNTGGGGSSNSGRQRSLSNGSDTNRSCYICASPGTSRLNVQLNLINLLRPKQT